MSITLDSNHIVVEVVRHETEILLEAKVAELSNLVGVLQDQVQELETKAGYEQVLNNELIDLLRQHHIPFRPTLEFSKYLLLK